MRKERLKNLLRLGVGVLVVGIIGFGIKENEPQIELNKKESVIEANLISKSGDLTVFVDSRWGERSGGVNLRIGETGIEMFVEQHIGGLKIFVGQELVEQEWSY